MVSTGEEDEEIAVMKVLELFEDVLVRASVPSAFFYYI